MNLFPGPDIGWGSAPVAWHPAVLRFPMPSRDSSLFRPEALEHYFDLEEGRTLVKVSPPWTWALLAAP